MVPTIRVFRANGKSCSQRERERANIDTEVLDQLDSTPISNRF